jgi:hypothetical protein
MLPISVNKITHQKPIHLQHKDVYTQLPSVNNNDSEDVYNYLVENIDNFDFMDEKIRPIIEQAIEEYKGPFII